MSSALIQEILPYRHTSTNYFLYLFVFFTPEGKKSDDHEQIFLNHILTHIDDKDVAVCNKKYIIGWKKTKKINIWNHYFHHRSGRIKLHLMCLKAQKLTKTKWISLNLLNLVYSWHETSRIKEKRLWRRFLKQGGQQELQETILTATIRKNILVFVIGAGSFLWQCGMQLNWSK